MSGNCSDDQLVCLDIEIDLQTENVASGPMVPDTQVQPLKHHLNNWCVHLDLAMPNVSIRQLSHHQYDHAVFGLFSKSI